MSKIELFKPIILDYNTRIRNLNVTSSGVVKSTKYFPVFEMDGEEKIFKPLSRTKPFTTPLFAYSEVFWSYITKKYFNPSAPLYTLAYCPGIEEDQPKYYPQGTLVSSILQNGQRLVNLYEFFEQFPDLAVNIHDYNNYCMKFYDYIPFLQSDFVRSNESVGNALAMQILLSILKQDQNFHYENVSFIYNGEQFVKVAPPIDSEFSTMFLFPDIPEERIDTKKRFYRNLEVVAKETEITRAVRQAALEVGFPIEDVISKNIIYLVENYPDVVQKFAKTLDEVLKELENIEFNDNYGYIGPCNSKSWEIGDARFKKHDELKAQQKEKEITLVTLDKGSLFKEIAQDVKQSVERLRVTLKTYLLAKKIGISNLETLTISEILEKLDIHTEEYTLLEDIDLDTNQLKFKN